MADLTKGNITQIRTIVREETDDIRGDISVLKSDVSKLTQGVHRTAVLQENLSHDFKAVAESISKNLKVKSKVDTHESRIRHLEGDDELLKATVTLHSQQLKRLGA